MRDLIRHILKEESLNNRILNDIDEEGIFAASDIYRLNENEEDPTKDILNFLLRRYEVEEENYGDDENPRIIKRVCFKLAKREVVCISQFMNKKSQIRTILHELMRLGVIKPFENDGTQNNPYEQKAVRAVKMFLNQVIE